MLPIARKKATLLGLMAALGLASGNAFATLDANLPGTTNIDNYDVNLTGGSILDNINQLNLTGFVLSDFGTTGAPSITGSNFTDYIVLNATSANTSGGGTQSGNLNQANGSEISTVIQLQGTITNGATGAFSFTGLSSFEVFLDALSGANPGASADANFAGYFNGTQVVTSNALGILTGAPVANTGALQPTVGAGGSFNFQNLLVDQSGGTFLRNAANTASLFASVAPESLFGLTEGQITLQAIKNAGIALTDSTCAGNDPTCALQEKIMQNFIAKYSIAASNTLQLTLVQTSPTFNIATQAAVPEPASLALLGLGLAGFGAFNRRKSKLSA